MTTILPLEESTVTIVGDLISVDELVHLIREAQKGERGDGERVL